MSSNAPHLDDDLLSAHLDGEAVDGAEHLGACADCRDRLDVLRSAAAAVRAPVPPAPTERMEAALAAARAAHVVPLRPRHRGLAVLAAAAAVVAVVGSLAVLRDDGGSGDTDTAALRDTSEQAQVPLFDGGDLGDQADPAELKLRLQAAVEPGDDSGAVAGSGSPAADSAQTPTRAPNAVSAKRSSEQEGFAAGARRADPDCAQAAREYAAGLGALQYRASLRWQGTPAVVLVYPVTGASGALDHRALVMATGDCRLLVAQTI